MVHLTKRERDELKAKGLWLSKKREKPVAFDGQAEFCRAAEEANRVVPFAHEATPVFNAQRFTMSIDPLMFPVHLQQMYNHVADNDIHGISESEEVNPKNRFAEAYIVNMADRIMDTHGLESLTEDHLIPTPRLVTGAYGILEEFGAVHDRGIVAEYSDPASLVRKLLWCAEQIREGENPDTVAERIWLPISPDDGDSKHTIAILLTGYLRDHGINVPFHSVKGSLFSDVRPECLDPQSLQALTLDNTEFVMRFFTKFKNETEFHRSFGTGGIVDFLAALGLNWRNPHPCDLGFHRSYSILVEDAYNRWKDHPQLQDPMPGQGGLSQVIDFTNDGDPIVPATLVDVEPIIVAETCSIPVLAQGSARDTVKCQLKYCFPDLGSEPLEIVKKASSFQPIYDIS
jgi:hypothetical protein